MLSEANKERLAQKKNYLVVDDCWVEVFPDDWPFLGESIPIIYLEITYCINF